MDIDLPALGFSLIFTFTVFVVIWLLEGYLTRKRERKPGIKPNMDLHVSTSERVHVDMPSSGALPNTEESEPTSESTEQPSLVCPECRSTQVVKRGFADKARRKQRYRSMP